MTVAAGIDGAIELIKLVGGPSAVAGLGWWLRGKFTDVKESAEQRMTLHERQDQGRHQQNLVRFAKINMKLGIGDIHEANGDSEV